MNLKSKEHYDLVAQFDREYKHLRLEKEDKALWSKSCIYKDGYVNALFMAYRSGYALGSL